LGFTAPPSIAEFTVITEAEPVVAVGDCAAVVVNELIAPFVVPVVFWATTW
jgi:hypothetical protein